ncbi:MAG: F-box protein [Candidatus Paracaedimonas acanthamoebae]|uniref:F-box protein n=1 Tax=Candidatus Paracaedimonas acanthamoebae TaxID=244581 RepID=A0A8J7PJW5_9PROT|nr:F-box protein [Candidatus Paracaedimonas acanthamoebae]
MVNKMYIKIYLFLIFILNSISCSYPSDMFEQSLEAEPLPLQVVNEEVLERGPAAQRPVISIEFDSVDLILPVRSMDKEHRNTTIEGLQNSEYEKGLGLSCCHHPFYYLTSLLGLFTQEKEEYPHASLEDSLRVLPNEIIGIIIAYLDPLSMVRFSHVNKKVREFLNNDYWIRYNLIHGYQEIEEENPWLNIWSIPTIVSPIKVMLANYYYEIGIKKRDKNLIKKSSTLGLLKAKKYLSETQASSTQVYPVNSYRYGIYTSGFYPRYKIEN